MEISRTAFRRKRRGIRFGVGIILMLIVSSPGCKDFFNETTGLPKKPKVGPALPAPVPQKGLSEPEPVDAERTLPAMTDEMITEAVEEKIHRDPVVNYDDIDVTVAKGIVTLDGEAESLLARERSARLAETVRGVRSVVNTVEVAPIEAVNDFKLYQDIGTSLAISASPDLAEKLTVTVQDGRVTLAVEVASWQERRTAPSRAKAVRGVKGIDDDIVVAVLRLRLRLSDVPVGGWKWISRPS